MLIGASPGTHGTSHSSGWLNGGIFLDKIHTSLKELSGRYQDGKQDAFIELNFPFQQGNWILLHFATNKETFHWCHCACDRGRNKSEVHREG
jgi:hypothetical protein